MIVGCNGNIVVYGETEQRQAQELLSALELLTVMDSPSGYSLSDGAYQPTLPLVDDPKPQEVCS